MVSWELFEAQSDEYRKSVLPPSVPLRLAVEAALPLGWERYVGDHGATYGVTRFGASAPAADLAGEYGFTPDQVADRVKALIDP